MLPVSEHAQDDDSPLQTNRHGQFKMPSDDKIHELLVKCDRAHDGALRSARRKAKVPQHTTVRAATSHRKRTSLLMFAILA